MQTRNPIVFVHRFVAAFKETLSSVSIESWKACQGVDAIIAIGNSELRGDLQSGNARSLW
ncbi:MAG: hypothetical protein SW833_10960 [Cyanobacteriota bacterium]|nr:hypothetical protein [Cyanobacteriota bacterium]